MAQRPDVRYIHLYTDGSAAYQLEPAKASVKKTAPKRAKQKRITVFIDPLAIAGTLVAAVMLVLLLVGFSQLRQAQQYNDAMAQKVERLRLQQEYLQDQFEDKLDLEELQWKAEALGLVPIDQVKHITVKAPEVEQPVKIGAWERFWVSLTSLFA